MTAVDVTRRCFILAATAVACTPSPKGAADEGSDPPPPADAGESDAGGLADAGTPDAGTPPSSQSAIAGRAIAGLAVAGVA